MQLISRTIGNLVSVFCGDAACGLCWYSTINKNFLSVSRFDVDIRGESSYKESDTTVAGEFLGHVNRYFKIKEDYAFFLHTLNNTLSDSFLYCE